MKWITFRYLKMARWKYRMQNEQGETCGLTIEELSEFFNHLREYTTIPDGERAKIRLPNQREYDLKIEHIEVAIMLLDGLNEWEGSHGFSVIGMEICEKCKKKPAIFNFQSIWATFKFNPIDGDSEKVDESYDGENYFRCYDCAKKEGWIK